MLITDKNVPIQIASKPFASGGEGEVYNITSPKNFSKQIVKIFKPSKRTAEREAKIQYMLAHPPAYLSNASNAIVWVKDLVYEEGKFVGYTMNMAYGVKLEYLCGSKVAKSIGKDFQKYDFKYKEAYFWRLKLAFNLAVAVVQLHKTGKYVMVDLKPDNVIVQANGKIALIDMDSIEIVENEKVLYPASAHTPEFSPSESLKIDKDLIPESWDRFSLAVNIYKLLFGIHPFTGTCKPPYENCNNVEQLIQHGLFPFTKSEHFEVVPPPHKRFLQSDLEIQLLFRKCFDTNTKPEDRPTAMDWCEALLPYARMVLNAPKIEEEKPKKKLIIVKEKVDKQVDKKKSWITFSRKKHKRQLPFQGRKVSWWKKFVQIQERITPEFIMLFLLFAGGLIGTSATYISQKIQEIREVENQRQYEIFVKKAIHFLEKDDAESAISSFAYALRYKPKDRFADGKLRILKKQKFLKVGEKLFSERKYVEAVSQYDYALQEIPYDSLTLARRADAVFAHAVESGEIASYFDIKLKIKKLPNYLYANCANELFISAHDLGHHFQPSYEVEGAELIEKAQKGRVTLIPRAEKVTFKLKNRGMIVEVIDFEVVQPPLPKINITPFWKDKFESPFLSISAAPHTNFSAYYNADAAYKVSKWKFSILREDKTLYTKIFTNPTVNSYEFKTLYGNEQDRALDKWQIDILEVVRRNYKGKYEPVPLANTKTKFVYNQYFEEIW
ncbi:protein kinase domain-containing protein [Thermoflexibacter ruber]|uniref:GldM C-terminal domain-containing protein n=1 Tax=Thermoflexibacter ruber TaxID=1003 RepID=A0A1I2E6E9_9BACT|nr:GldM family protein [Thermoflexibacter ruber]SFE88199.1 GldM C-terminal domain-containing protein [Thermoflexibacter ruber]